MKNKGIERRLREAEGIGRVDYDTRPEQLCDVDILNWRDPNHGAHLERRSGAGHADLPNGIFGSAVSLVRENLTPKDSSAKNASGGVDFVGFFRHSL